MPTFQFPGEFAQLVMVIGIAMTVATVIVHIMFAVAVAMDARQRERSGARPELVGSLTWCIATLLGGVLVGGLYWVMHRSTLCRRADV